MRLSGEFAEAGELFAEQIVAGHHDDVIVHFFTLKNQMQVADGAEFVGVVRGTIIDDGEIQFRFIDAVGVGPFLEMRGELGMGDDEHAVEAGNAGEIVEHVVDHRLARDGQQRLRLREGQRIEPSGVTGGEDDQFHW